LPDPELVQLRSEVERLVEQVAQLERRLAALESDHPVAPNENATALGSRKAEGEKPDSGLGLKFINRIGAITLAIGIVFFFKYAVDNQWIGAAGRVILGVLAGFVQIGLAEWLRRRNQLIFSQGLAGCGLATLYISIYAAEAYYFLIPQTTAFLLLVGACILASPLSFLYNNPAIATLGLIGGFLTPPLLGQGEPHPWILFPYLLLLDLGSLAVTIRRRWPVLMGIAFVGTAILFALAISVQEPNLNAGLFFLPIFFVLFFSSALRNWTDGQHAIGASLIWANAAWSLICIWMLLDQQDPIWLSLYCFVLAAVHFIAASRWRANPRAFSTLYMAAHLCFAIGGLRLLSLWAQVEAAPATRISLISELDSVFLAIYAVVMIAIAVIRRSALDRILGLAMIGIVIAKLYFYDVWRLDRFYRISAFVALGVLLLAASFVYSRFHARANTGS